MKRYTRRNFLKRASTAALLLMLGFTTKTTDPTSCYGTSTYGTAVYGGQPHHHHRI